jgi:hypothetical protein
MALKSSDAAVKQVKELKQAQSPKPKNSSTGGRRSSSACCAQRGSSRAAVALGEVSLTDALARLDRFAYRCRHRRPVRARLPDGRGEGNRVVRLPSGFGCHDRPLSWVRRAGPARTATASFCFATQRRFPETAIGIDPELLELLGPKNSRKTHKNRQKLDKYSETPIFAAKKLVKNS